MRLLWIGAFAQGGSHEARADVPVEDEEGGVGEEQDALDHHAAFALLSVAVLAAALTCLKQGQIRLTDYGSLRERAGRKRRPGTRVRYR